jgi:transcriptional regulator GlxA family with amidase domain
MKNVAILVPEKSMIQAIADPNSCFRAVNRFLKNAGKLPLFNVSLVGLKKEVMLGDRFSVYPDNRLNESTKYNLVIIPALSGDMSEAVAANKKLVPWIVNQYNRGSEIASLCGGVFILASTGLLNGRRCATHWRYINDFRNMFPKANIQEGSIIEEEDNIYSSGGSNSYWNLLLYLVEKYSDRETAVTASKYFAIDISRSTQSPFSIFKGQKEHNDDAVKKAQEFIEENIEKKISVEALAEKVAVGRRSFERRFKQVTSNSVLEYIHRVKIEGAKRSFETSSKNINEVMFDIGYTDTKAFRTIFRKITGLTPVEYRNKFNRISSW